MEWGEDLMRRTLTITMVVINRSVYVDLYVCVYVCVDL